MQSVITTPTFKPENTISPWALLSVNYWTQLLILWVILIRRENDLILSQWYCLWFDLRNRCRQNGTKTEQEDGRNKALFLSSQSLFLSPFLAYPLRTAAILISYDLEMKTRKQNKNNKRTDREQFASFIERIQTHVAFGWLRKNFMPENFLDDEIMLCFDVIYCNTIGQWNNAFSDLYKGFLWRKNEESLFWTFHPLVYKTNNKHLPKSFSFKVIRKSLYSLLSCFVCFFVCSFFVTPGAPRASMWEARSLSFDRLCSQSSIKIYY